MPKQEQQIMRHSREIAYSDLPADQRAAIEAYLEKWERELGEVLMVCVTDHEQIKKKKGLFGGGGGPPHVSQSVGIITRKHLYMLAVVEKKGIQVTDHNLRDIEVRDDPLGHMHSETGFSMQVVIGDGYGTQFVGVGDDAAGRAFRAKLEEAVAAVKSV